MFKKCPGESDSIPGRIVPEKSKIVLGIFLFNTRHETVRIKGKVEQSKEKHPPLHHGVVAFEKGAFGSP